MDRDALAVANLDLAWPIARSVCLRCRLPRSETDDVAAEARLLLVVLAREYSADHGIPFRAFASQRLPWRLIDSLRATKLLTRKHQCRRPTFLPLNTHEYRGPVETFRATPFPSRLMDSTPPWEEAQREDVREILRRYAPGRKASRVVGALLAGANQREAGEAVGVSESRASQLVKIAVNGLREALKGRQQELLT